MKCAAAVIRIRIGRAVARSDVDVNQAGTEGSTHDAVMRRGDTLRTRTSLHCVPQGAVGWGSLSVADGSHGPPAEVRSQRRLPMMMPLPPPRMSYRTRSGAAICHVVLSVRLGSDESRSCHTTVRR